MDFIPSLTDFLRVHKCIYTVRMFKYRGSSTYVENVGMCRRSFVGPVCMVSDLEAYVALSGFDDADSWWKAAKIYIKPGQPKYLYRLEVVKAC